MSHRRVCVLVASGAVLIYLVCVIPQLGRPLMYDDANFALAAKAVADTGLPYGNQGWMSDRGDFSHREQWALWHPPLYVYLDGALARLGGWSPPVLRLLGLAGGLATAVLTWLLARDFTRGPPLLKDVAGATAVVLVMVCPLVVQSTLVLDIDFALLLPLCLAVLWLYIRLENSARAWLWLVPLFAVTLWAKMTNPVALIGVIGVWQVLRGHFVRAALHVVVIGLGGAALAGLAWLALGTGLGFPLDMPFSVNQVQWQDSAEVARRAYTNPGAFIEGLQPSVIWFGPGLVTLALAAVALRIGQLAACWRVRRVDLLIGFATVLVLGYVNKSAGWFPKYQVALVPLLACISGPLAAHVWCLRPRPTTLIAVLAAAASFGVTLRLVRDGWALERTWAIEAPPAAWLALVVLVAAASGIAWRASASTAFVAVLGVALGWSVAIDAVQLRAPYQTDYWYGTTGTAEAADWVSSHLQPNETYIAAKEVAIRASAQRYVDQDTIVYFLAAGRALQPSWAGEPIRGMVVWEREPYLRDVFARAAAAFGLREDAQFGDYVVYVPSE